MNRCICSLAILQFILHVFGSITVLTPYTSTNTSIRVWPQKYDGNTINFEPIIGQLVEASESNKTGKIVLLSGCTRPYEPEYRRIQNQGAIAILCGVLGPPRDRKSGNEMFEIDGSDTSDINVPIVTVIIKDIESILSPNKTVFITLTTERNEFIDLFSSGWMWVWQLSLIAFSLFNAGFAVFRIVVLVRFYDGCKRTVGLCCLLLCLAASMGIMLYISIDPLGCRRISPYWLVGVMETLPLPIIIAPLFLMSLWWHTLLKSLKFQVHPGLPRFRWIFYAWVTFLIVQELIISITNVFVQVPTFVQFISPTLYFLGYTLVLVYCCVTLYRLQRRVKKLQAQSKQSTLELFRIKVQLVAVVVNICSVYILYISFLLGATRHLTGYVTWFWFFWLMMSSLITVQLVSLRPPQIKSKDIRGPSCNSTSKRTIVDMHLKTNDRYTNESKTVLATGQSEQPEPLATTMEESVESDN